MASVRGTATALGKHAHAIKVVSLIRFGAVFKVLVFRVDADMQEQQALNARHEVASIARL